MRFNPYSDQYEQMGPSSPEMAGPPTPPGYFDQDTINNFLSKISQIESSGGKNTKHPEISEGIHQGESAIGQYGLMPNTLNDIIKVAKIKGESVSPELSGLYESPEDITKKTFKEHPEVENEAATMLARRVLDKYSDPEKAAYAWNVGHYSNPSEITPEKLNESDYIQKFRTLSNLMRKK